MSNSNNLFSDSTSIDSGVDDLQNPKFNYTGHFDKQGFRDQYGCQTWDQPFQHKYAGYFLYNNMHDKGFYFIRQEDGVSFYDGQFYNNKLEGYGQVIYKDGRIHEGLFRDNKKFGPGVVTYPDETQDVGLWNSNYLIRLSISMTSDLVPSLCHNPANKIKLLRFKKIVPVSPERKDIAKVLMSSLTNDQSFSQRYPELYNPHVRNENSLFFDRRLYDLAQLGSEDTVIEVLEDEAFVDIYSDITDAEDSVCPCIDERCVHITKQINEIETELRNIHEIKRKYGKQLEKCKKCCKSTHPKPLARGSDSQNSSSSYSKEEDTKYPSKASFVDDFATSGKHVVHKNLEQMRNQTSIVEELMVTGGGFIVNRNSETSNNIPQKRKTDDSINKIFVNNKHFQSDISMDSSDQDKFFDNDIEKYACTCMDEEVPNTDFLVEQLEKLGKKEKFYHTVVNFLNGVLYKEFSRINKSSSSKVIKLPVEDLLAWNNGKVCIEIMQHCFRYRNFEKILSFNIKSLLVGDRNAFGKMGKIEATCINFLKHCMNNQIDEVRRDLFCHNIYPDLADARGNTGLHLAVTFDRHEIIQQLANVGANLDSFNDECLTPLLLAILRYIAILNKVVFWDKAFLTDIVLNMNELDQVTQWRPHESLVSISDYLGSTSHLPKTEHRSFPNEMKKGSEEISVKMRSHLQSMKSSSVASKINVFYLLSTSFVEDYERYKKIIASRKTDEIEEKDVGAILRTVEVLLHYGADPNIGSLPMKPILLAIFTKNLNMVEKLLQHSADPNSVTEENMSALHLLASLPFTLQNVQMTEKFLKFSTDPNKKSAGDLWLEQNEELIGAYVSPISDTEDYDGKTPLQMVVMRKDFDEENVNYQCDLVRILIEYGALHDQYYLGHTLLSIAVLRGNKKLIEILNRYVELGQPLGENMGNALTLLGLCRYPLVRPFSICKITIDTLITSGMNPFNPVYDFANIYEFFLYDSSNDVDYDTPKVRANIEAEDLSMRKLLNADATSVKNCNKLSVAYLKELGREILMNLYRYNAIQILILFASEDLLYHKCLVNMAKFFTIQEALDCLKFHIHRNKIILDDEYVGNIVKVLNYIKAQSDKGKELKKNVQKNPETSSEPSLEELVSKLHKDFDVPNYIVMYALDSNPEKYEVCFHCLRKSNKKLLSCPCCGSVKFCSEMCNKYNNKLSTKHSCNILFYDEMKSSCEKSTDNFPLTGIDLLMMEAKQIREEERQAQLQRIHTEEEEKLKKHLRKSQKIDSQSTLTETKSRSRSFMDRSASVSFISDKKTPKSKMSCCKKPSSFFICDETAQLRPRTLKCGFHCGQIIPDVQIDDEGNVVREKEFCECYPLYNKERASKDEIRSKIQEKPEGSDQYSAHYSISDIFGGILFNEERINREVEELDMLIDTFAKEERRTSTVPEDQQQENAQESEAGMIGGSIEPVETKHKSKVKSASDVGLKKRKVKSEEKLKGKTKKSKEKVESQEITEDSQKEKEEEGVEGKQKSKKGKKVKSDTEIIKQKKKEKDKEGKKVQKKTTGYEEEEEEKDEKKKGEKRKKVKSDTDIIKKKKEAKKEKKDKKTSKKKKDQQEPEIESPMIDEKKKKKQGKESRSDDALGTDKKKKKKGKEDKSVGGSSKHDKKTMTKKIKERKPKKKDEGIQADVKHEDRKSKETSSKSTATSKKKKGKMDKSIEDKSKKLSKKKIEEKKKAPEKKKTTDRKLKEPKKKEHKKKEVKKETKRTPKSKKSEKRSDKTTEFKKRKQKEGLLQKPSTKERKISKPQVDKFKRDIAIPKSDVDSNMLNQEKILALSNADFQDFKKISRVYQYFLELIAQYFPDFDLSCLMLPFACFMDGQLYYKFTDASPYYCRTYSTM